MLYYFPVFYLSHPFSLSPTLLNILLFFYSNQEQFKIVIFCRWFLYIFYENSVLLPPSRLQLYSFCIHRPWLRYFKLGTKGSKTLQQRQLRYLESAECSLAAFSIHIFFYILLSNLQKRDELRYVHIWIFMTIF